MKRYKRQILVTAFWICIAVFPIRGQMIMRTPKQDSAIDKRRISVTIVGRAGAKTWLYVNDVLADSGEIRIDGQYDFLNIEVPEGPVQLRTEAIGAGNRLYKATRRVHIIGRPDTLIANKKSIELPADGQSTMTIHVRVKDAWGYQINRLKIANVFISKGTLTETDLDSLSPGYQVPIQESEFEFTVKSAAEVGSGKVNVRIDEKSLEIPLYYTTPLSRFILVGSMDAAASAAELGDKDHGTPKFTLADWTHQEGDIKNIPVSGRLAFYGKGSWLHKYQITASYDSRRTRDNQLFRDLDPDKQYALYGDASTIIYDAQTQSKFYGRIERNESSITLGDYNTDLRNTEFAKYDRSFNGFYSKINIAKQGLTTFATLNDRTMQLDEIRGEGISGYYYLTKSRITLNSDKVRIETRDRYHPEIIIRSEEKTRFIDYDINYVDGTLMFKQPVSSVDASGNPVYIIAIYEYQDNSDKSLIGGMRYEGAIQKFKLGSTFIVEEKKPSNFYLYGMDATLPVTKWLKLKGEFAQAQNTDFSNKKQTGNAYFTQIDFEPQKSVHLNGYYRKVEDDFFNPSQTGSRFEVGAEKYGTKNEIGLGKVGKIHSEFYRQFNDIGTVNEYHIQVANAFYEYNISKKTSAKLGYEDAERRKAGQDSTAEREYRSKMIHAQISHQWNKHFSTELEHEQNLAEGETTLPTGTSIGITYRLSERIELFLKQRLLDTKGKKTQTIFGIDSKLNRNTQMTGKYEIGGAAGEDWNRATIGLKNKWEVRKDLTLNFAFESTATMDSLEVPTPENNAISVGIEYLPDKPWKSSGKYELRQDKTVRKQVITLGSEYKILNGLSLIGRMEKTGANYLHSSNEIWNRNNYQLGMAYRPETHDIFNAVFKLQLLTDKNTHVAPKSELNRFIISSNGFLQVSAKLEFGLRFALRRLLDREIGLFSSKTTTSLYSIRTDYHLSNHWTTGMDLRLVYLSPISQSKIGTAGEIGYVFRKNMLAGVGYIFKKLDDSDFSYSEYNYANVYVVFRMKFSEDIFNWR